jgi:hypothetical protein
MWTAIHQTLGAIHEAKGACFRAENVTTKASPTPSHPTNQPPYLATQPINYSDPTYQLLRQPLNNPSLHNNTNFAGAGGPYRNNGAGSSSIHNILPGHTVRGLRQEDVGTHHALCSVDAKRNPAPQLQAANRKTPPPHCPKHTSTWTQKTYNTNQCNIRHSACMASSGQWAATTGSPEHPTAMAQKGQRPRSVRVKQGGGAPRGT